MLTEAQKEAREHGIGASSAGTVMGANPWCTPHKLYLQLTGKIPPEPEATSGPLWWGHKLEPIIAEAYEIKTGCKLIETPETLYHPQHKNILCHLDRMVVDASKFIEIKTANSFSFIGDEWGEEATDNIPETYVWQVQQQLAITGFADADLVVFPKGSQDIKIYCIKRDEELIAMLIERVNDFWFNHVLADVPPPLSIRDDVNYVYPRNDGNFAHASGFIAKQIENFKIHRDFIKTTEKERKKMELDILKYIGHCDGIKDSDGKVIATWKADKNGTRVLRIR